ncbi:MAG: trehalase family glycosidase [Gemmatimonadota bacterium]|uniref:MGH1-like glycoside hydrolase domain-containing protein n=1 Tax=Candidatus Palauibacter scopulicola TaxID=3056741 RepID=UPI0023850E15|nr:trehalase family glycosidase [Candidatus Palauibacter scopulicola]MDE2661642.1 trehalase family glycosidase [Candidatus Palauibacter scopulicola]
MTADPGGSMVFSMNSAPSDPAVSPRARIAALARDDKWFLGGLDGVVWAPPFPQWLHRPGFWDPAHLLQHEVGPGFSIALVGSDGRESPLHRAAPGPDDGEPAVGRWRPGRLVVTWADERGTLVEERRRVLPGGILESAWGVPRDFEGHLVAFTAQPAGATHGVAPTADGVGWTRVVSDRRGQELALRMELAGSGSPAWRRVVPSEGRGVPEWRHSPFAEEVGAPESAAAAGADPTSGPPHDPNSGPRTHRTGWIWIAVAFPLTGIDGGGAPAIRLNLRLRETESRRRAATPSITPAPTSSTPPSDEIPTPSGWESFFGGFPHFESGDPYLDRTFDYRIYGLGLNRIEGRWGPVRRPAIAEGPEYFHVPIAYSAQCHMMEMRWRKGGREAWGSLLNFVDNQKPDGSFHGRLYPERLEGTDFYHANWGDALLAVDDMHPDAAALARCYEGLSRYARWLKAARDSEASGMFTVTNHFETGQEYMSRYMAVDEEADVAGWRPRLRLKGIDVTVYAHQLFRALAAVARRLERPGDEAGWRGLEARCRRAIDEHMWSAEAGLFTDVDGRTGERTGVKAAVGFYPLLIGGVEGTRLDALLDHLEDPGTFGTRFPLPSSSVDDPRFSAEGIWRGKRRNCPWNGRVWPMTTSHVIEGLLRCWRGGNARAGALAADMLRRFARMMFTDGDPSRPNCFEHYNPHTGRACHFRGIDDYQHSWILDLLARGFGGLHVDASGIEVRPLPNGPPRVSLGPVFARGRELRVQVGPERVRLEVDGERFEGPRGEALRVPWIR